MSRRFMRDCWPIFVFGAIWLIVGTTEPPTAISFLAGAFGVFFCWGVELRRRDAA